ncbi:MAG: Na/Pi symporter [Fidelibacterota bacterium]
MNGPIISTKAPAVRWINWFKMVAIVVVLYAFLISVGLIGAGFKGLGKSFAETLISSTAGPLLGLFIGILATTVIQSSSTTTSLVVGMVAAGTFGDDPRVAIAMAVPYIMGANIGTSVTNTIVSLGHIVSKIEFKRAFSASIIHDFFNIFSVLVLFPLQLYTGFLGKLAYGLATFLMGTGSFTFKSPIKVITKPAIHGIENLLELQSLVNPHWLTIFVALVLLFLSLRYLTKLIRSLVISRLEAFFDTHIFKTAGRALLFGVFITVLVQSSSITTSLVIPLAGAGILTLRQIFPYTLGANIGTTITALLASLVSATLAPVAVALSHLLFNILGIIVIWPIPQVRVIPLRLAEWFSGLAIRNRIIPIIYIIVLFYIVPLTLIFIVR